MATLANLVERTRDVLYGVGQLERPAEDTIDGAILAAAEAVTVDTEAMWKRGDYAEFADGEVVIFAADASGSTAIRRAQRGTTAADQADAAVILKNPWPLRKTIEQQINDVVLTDLWPHVWSWHQGTVTFTVGDHLYALPEYIEEVVRVDQANVDSDGKLRPMPTRDWDVERQVSTSIATNKNLLRLRNPYDVDSDIHYRGKRRPHPDDLANVAEQLEPMIAWGAAAKCFVAQAGASSQDRGRNQRRDARTSRELYQMLMGEFLRLRSDYHHQLMTEVGADSRFRPRMRVGW